MQLPLPFHFAALALCHVEVLLYACDLQLPTVQWRAAGATYSLLVLLIMELAYGGSTCTLCFHSLLHTWSLSRLSVHTSDEAVDSNLRLGKSFARVTSTVRDDIIRECLTDELYMKLVHASATRRQGCLCGPERRPIILEPCIFGTGTARQEGMVHVLTLCIAMPATLYMDEGTQSLKLDCQV